MEIIQSWKNSLRILAWDSIKTMMRQCVQKLPAIYCNWFMYGWWAYVLLAIGLWFFPYGNQNADVVVLGIILGASLVFAWAITFLFIIVKCVLRGESVSLSLKKYSMFIAYCRIISMLMLAGVLFWFHYAIIEMLIWGWEFDRHLLKKLALEGMTLEDLIRKTGVVISLKTYQDWLTHLKIIVHVLLVGMSAVAYSLYFVMFFLSDSQVSFGTLIISIKNCFKLIFYNLPLLIVVHLIFMVAMLPFGILLKDWLINTQANILLNPNPLLLFLIHQALIPPCVMTIYRLIYEKIVQQEPQIYG